MPGCTRQYMEVRCRGVVVFEPHETKAKVAHLLCPAPEAPVVDVGHWMERNMVLAIAFTAASHPHSPTANIIVNPYPLHFINALDKGIPWLVVRPWEMSCATTRGAYRGPPLATKKGHSTFETPCATLKHHISRLAVLFDLFLIHAFFFISEALFPPRHHLGGCQNL